MRHFIASLLCAASLLPSLGQAGDAAPPPTSLYISPEHPVFRRVASSGHADLLTVEREGILHSQVLTLRGSDPVIELPIPKGGAGKDGAEAIAVISHGLWRELGGNASIIGTRPVR